MSTPAVTLVTYLWHYALARMLYDELVRPLAHSGSYAILLVAAALAGAFLLGRRSGGRA